MLFEFPGMDLKIYVQLNESIGKGLYQEHIKIPFCAGLSYTDRLQQVTSRNPLEPNVENTSKHSICLRMFHGLREMNSRYTRKITKVLR